MSEVIEMPKAATAAPAAIQAPAAPVVAAPAPKLNAIQLIENEIAGFIKQHATALQQQAQAQANVHAIEGAIQAAQMLVGKLKAEAAKAETEVANAAKAVEEKL